MKSTLRWIGVVVASSLYVFAASVSHQLHVEVRPEAALSRRDEATLLLKVRLAPRAQAVLWNARSCNAPDPGAYRVVRSGTYTIPFSSIPGPATPALAWRLRIARWSSFYRRLFHNTR